MPKKKTPTNKKVVIVESPAKTASIARYLGDDYLVVSSKGHIIDLPKSDIGIDIKHNYKPEYVAMHGKKNVITALKKDAKDADTVYLATDMDREGEAIAWHIASALGTLDDDGKLKKNAPIKRVVFSEITKEAITEAFNNPRSIDYNLIDAYQARRVLDRLVGYKLSPLLWKKIQYGLSAGRVQSVTVRLVVEREHERDTFSQTPYFRIIARITHNNMTFDAELTEIETQKIEQKETLTLFAGTYTFSSTSLTSSDSVNKHLETLHAQKKLLVANVDSKESSKSPQAPFTTASLQRAAQTYLYMTAKSTMMNAQHLYEEGFITYHRTDSTNLSDVFVTEARTHIEKTYGPQYVPKVAPLYKDTSKRTQEAHEAIRPTHVSDWEKTKEKIESSLGEKEAELYELIARRSLSSQAEKATYLNTAVTLTPVQNKASYTFLAKGSVITFPGFLAITKSMGEDTILPPVIKGELLDVADFISTEHKTSPPPRYSEASLIHALEEHGIGRPSTYAPIIDTIQNRQYALKENNAFVPEDFGIAVNHLLVDHFPAITDLDFTADMEQKLDDVAEGKLKWQTVIDEFYKPFEKKLEEAEATIQRDDYKVLKELEEKCLDCGNNLELKLGKYGKFYSCSTFPDCKFAKPFLELIGMKCPTCKDGEAIVRRTRFGKKFFGCSNYPNCTWAEWKDPRKIVEEVLNSTN